MVNARNVSPATRARSRSLCAPEYGRGNVRETGIRLADSHKIATHDDYC